MSEPEDEQEPKIFIQPEQMAGVWANYARVGHSPYEFTLDFVRLDFNSEPKQGIVVARVSVSPLFITQLIDALSDNWKKFAHKSLPPEVRQLEQPESDGQGPADPAPEAGGRD